MVAVGCSPGQEEAQPDEKMGPEASKERWKHFGKQVMTVSWMNKMNKKKR